MCEPNIRGVKVKFPYEKPYDIQIEYMNKVIECVEDGRHGVLESPTGTGKTLCLLAPVTSWLRHKKRQMPNQKPSFSDDFDANNDGGNVVRRLRSPRVWYTARTHSQIAQTISELRRCDIEGLSIRVVGARDQLCVNPVVLQEKESFMKTVKCKELVKSRSCRFYKNLDFAKQAPDIYQPGEVLDIEDLASRGRSCGICPYHLARNAKESADIVLMPYNYVIDRESRGPADDTYRNGILIFDEGHNVPNSCEESFEFSLTSADLTLAVSNIKELMKALTEIEKLRVDDDAVDYALHAGNCVHLLKLFNNLEAQLENFSISSVQYSFHDLIKFCEDAGLSLETSGTYLGITSAFTTDSAALQLTGPMIATLTMLERIVQTMFGSAIMSFDPDIIDKSFKFVVASDPRLNHSKKLSLFCFNPAFAIKEVLLLGVQSMILTSGTLSPLRNFIHELGLPDPVTLENNHIATKAQVPFMILGTGVNNARMDASFNNRTNEDYMYSLGMSLTNLISSIPDGVLLLFSSYSVMQALREYWDKCGVWTRLNTLKRVFLEPKGKEEFLNNMENYRRAIDSKNGAVLMGVLRGKISEGMDFKDQYCRGVFIVGVPFPPVMDPRVKGKAKYAESLVVLNPATKRMERLYANNVFMSVEAMKATNQAIGRVIRHAADYGAIVLVDHRFARPGLFFNISRWLRSDRATEINFPTAKKILRDFFKEIHVGNLGVPEVRSQDLSANGDPIAAKVQYEMYDHKTAKRHVPAPWIASGIDSGVYSESAVLDAGLDMSIYKSKTDEESNSCSASPVFSSGSYDSPRNLLDSLESDYIPSLRLRLARANATRSKPGSSLEVAKRKCDDVSQPMPSSQRRRIRVQAKPFRESFVEPEVTVQSSDDAKQAKRHEVIEYIQEVRNRLSQQDGMIFKDTVYKYIKGQSVLCDIVPKVKELLTSISDSKDLIHEFRKCVRSKDKESWDDIVMLWNEI